MCPRTRVSTRVRHCRARTRSMNLTCTYGWQIGLQNTGEAPGSGC